MKTLSVPVKDQTHDRLIAIAKWNNCSPDFLARHILDQACTDIWRENGPHIRDMMQGLEHFEKL